MKKGFSFLILLILLAEIHDINAQSTLQSKTLEGYELTIYLPNGYRTSDSYPTVYFNDGQMLFGKFDMDLKGTLDSLIGNKRILPLVVVGIHADRFRSEKYVPYTDSFVAKASSQHQAYADFLVKKLIPWMDANYSTKKTAAHRAIFGVSFGGLQATWMTLNHPKSFGFSAGLSPSFWVNSYEIFTEAKKRSDGQKFWFDIGTSEWNYYVPMITALENAGGNYGESIFYLEDPAGEHNARWWGQRVKNPLMLFAGTSGFNLKKMTVEIAVIPSQSRKGVYYQRLNPIITCKFGLKYSLAQKADYTVLNPEAGAVKADGSFLINDQQNMQVLVKYGDFEKKIVLKYSAIQRLKK
jgi:enterochelin esterase-like enzyme